MTPEAEVEVMPPQIKERQQSPEARRRREGILPQSLQRECGPVNTSVSVFWTP